MDEQEARLILQAYRPGDQDEADPQVAEALKLVEKNPELARWFAEEREFDRAIAAHLASLPAPFGLKTRILANAATRSSSSKTRWAVGLAVLAACLFLLAQLVSLVRGSSQAAVLLPDYAREMVSFIRLTPPLELESSDPREINDWLRKREVPQGAIPAPLSALDPIGCRVLSFRGHDVTLICFRRSGNRLAHLFMVDRAALPKLKAGAAPLFSAEGEWMTASWAEKDRAYMIAVQGDRETVQRYLPDA